MNKTSDRSRCPRPDFVRERWTSLNGEWEFSFDTDAFDRHIQVPFCYQSRRSGIGESEDHDVVWYRRRFPANLSVMTGGRLLLRFGAVDTRADVWVNGSYLGSHVGGYTPFAFDITDLVRETDNVVTVRAEDRRDSDKPRGKQTWTGKPFECWYTPVTGIWQSVWLEYTGSVYLERLKVTPDAVKLEAQCELFLSSGGEVWAEVTALLAGQVLCRQEVLCREGYGKTVLAFQDGDVRRGDLLWSPERPNLIDVTVTLHPAAGQPDTVESYFGLRSGSWGPDGVFLNGHACFQRLVLDQGYWPDTLLTPPDGEALVQDIRLVKALGFNGVRKHQKIEDPRFYYWADRLGLLVWGELPSAYGFTDRAVRASAETLFEFVERDFNHPSIVGWVPMNESWGAQSIGEDRQQQNYSRMLLYQLKALDSTRFVSANDGWEQVTETDICTIHNYQLRSETIEQYDAATLIRADRATERRSFARGNQWTGQPVLLSEYGGIAFEDGNAGNWGYQDKAGSREAFLARLAPVTDFLLRSGQFAGFCYTQLTDVMQETNGLLTMDRTSKLPLAELAAIFGGT